MPKGYCPNPQCYCAAGVVPSVKDAEYTNRYWADEKSKYEAIEARRQAWLLNYAKGFGAK